MVCSGLEVYATRAKVGRKISSLKNPKDANSRARRYIFGRNPHRNRAADRLVIDGAVCTMMEALTKRCRSLLTYWNETPRRAATCCIGKGKSASLFAAAFRAKFFSIRNRSRSVSDSSFENISARDLKAPHAIDWSSMSRVLQILPSALRA